MFEVSLIGQIQVVNRLILKVQHQAVNRSLVAMDISNHLVALHRNHIQQILCIELVMIWKFISVGNNGFLIVEWQEFFHISIGYQTVFTSILFLAVVNSMEVEIAVF